MRNIWKQLDGYQKDGVDFAHEVKTSALFYEQGTGKTWITLGLLERIMHEAFIGIMVVPLTNIDSTWEKNIRAEMPELNLCMSWEEFEVAPRPKLWLVHYEGLKPYIKGKRKARQWYYDFIGYDESQRLKGRGSRQSRDATMLRNSAEYKVILSGTPQEADPCDLFAQFRFLAPHVLGERWGDFEREYMVQPDVDPKLHKGSMAWRKAIMKAKVKKAYFNPAKLKKFQRAIGPYTWRVEAADVLKLKKLSVVHVPVQMYGYQQRVYDHMERHMLVRLKRAKIVAPLKIVQIGKLQQICGGAVKDNDDVIHRVGRAKLRALKRLLKKRTGPAVVFFKFREEMDLVKEELMLQDGLKINQIRGGMKRKDKRQIIEDFQAGKIDVLLVQIRTGSIGIDLFASNYAICYSITHSLIDFLQMIKRLHRRGQLRAVNIFLLYCVGTVDEDINTGIERKERLSRETLTNLIQQRRRQ